MFVSGPHTIWQTKCGFKRLSDYQREKYILAKKKLLF